MNTNIYDDKNGDELTINVIQNFIKNISQKRESITMKFKSKTSYYSALCTLYDKNENLIRVRFYNQTVELQRRAKDEFAMCDFVDVEHDTEFQQFRISKQLL
jgi:c-di-AMP phosphodiesterase-like protein